MIEHVLLGSDVLLSMLFFIQLLDLIVTVDFRAHIDAQHSPDGSTIQLAIPI